MRYPRFLGQGGWTSLHLQSHFVFPTTVFISGPCNEEDKMMGIEELCNACARGDTDTVIFLLNMGVYVNGRNKYNRTPLQVGRNCCFDRVKRGAGMGCFFALLCVFSIYISGLNYIYLDAKKADLSEKLVHSSLIRRDHYLTLKYQ